MGHEPQTCGHGRHISDTLASDVSVQRSVVHGPFCAEATCTHRQLGTQTVAWFKGQSFMVSQVVLAQHGSVTAHLWMLKLLIKDPFKRFQRQLAGSSWPVSLKKNLY